MTQAAPSLSTEYVPEHGLWEASETAEDQASQKPQTRSKRRSGNEHHNANKAKRSTKKHSTLPDDKDAIVEKWVSHEETKALVSLIPHRILGKWTVLDQAILGLYGICKAGMKDEVAPSLIVNYLYDAFKVKVAGNKLRANLSYASKNGLYINYQEGRGYCITPSGCEYIEEKLRDGAPH